MNRSPRHWAVVPAAGVGRRMGAAVPKQYLSLAGRPVIERTIERLCRHPAIEAVVVALSPEDGYWPAIERDFGKPVVTAKGGAERCYSVLNGLEALAGRAAADDWVLVHDAARPCLRSDDIDRLIETLAGHEVGGILGVPVADTVKRCDESGTIVETVDRAGLWRAMTPQMFRFETLRRALRRALDDAFLVTDEASAIEHAGLRPRMVEGHGDNIKITRPEDLALAELYLRQQQEEAP